MVGERVYSKLRTAYREYVAVYQIDSGVLAENPILLCAYKGYNIVKMLDTFYAARHGLGDLDLTTEEGRAHPELLVSSNYSALLKLVRNAYQSGRREIRLP
jgi:hypothetical protein